MKLMNMTGSLRLLGAILMMSVLAPACMTDAIAATTTEKANKKLVVEFYAALNKAEAAGTLKQDIGAIADRFLQPDYLQHSGRMAAFGSGRDGFLKLFQQMPDMPRNPNAKPPATVAVMAEGDKVMLLTSRDAPPGSPDRTIFTFNMFRVRDGKLSEHWEEVSPVMPAGPGAPATPPVTH
ncbi:nuclear transport factor 2 family protein [Hydrocarboniphaga sp.]|uniref:nuclear transport factor 2 family protein n=1 Tax=Hydrocarboniphaga sp. TaxID=2033016 RepID=UPI003D11B797